MYDWSGEYSGIHDGISDAIANADSYFGSHEPEANIVGVGIAALSGAIVGFIAGYFSGSNGNDQHHKDQDRVPGGWNGQGYGNSPDPNDHDGINR